jgi:kinesin family member C2/C3
MCADDVEAALGQAHGARATAATALNAASSRSHAIVSVRVAGVRDGVSVTSTLHLVDLAGSERVDKSEVTGAQLREAQVGVCTA